jgi:hypothetical protein
MGLETAPQSQLGRIDPSSIIGKAGDVVNPSAIEMLSDSVRKGFITAEDIKAHLQADPARRERANLETMLAKEGQSPEAQSMRSNQRQALGATAKAQTELVPTEQKARDSELKAAILDAQMKGAGVQEMQAALAKAGWVVPVDPNTGMTQANQQEINRRFGVLLNFVSERSKAETFDKESKAENPDIEVTDASGNVIKGPSATPVITFRGQSIPAETFKKFQQYKMTLQGMSPAMFDALGQPKAPDIFGTQPGQVQPAATPAPATPAPAAPAGVQVLPNAPAATQQEAIARDAQLSRLLPNQIQTKQAAKPVVEVTPTEATPGQPFGPMSMVTGMKTGKEHDTTAANELSQLQSDLQSVQRAKALIADKSINVVGPAAGSSPVQTLNQIGAAFGIRGKEYESQVRLTQEINKKVLEGARNMKGNLSDKDVRFLKESFPALTSPEPVWTDFLNNWEKMIHLNEQVIRGTAAKGASIFDKAAAAAGITPGAPSAPAAGQAGPVVTLSTGRKVQRDANGVYQIVP